MSVLHGTSVLLARPPTGEPLYAFNEPTRISPIIKTPFRLLQKAHPLRLGGEPFLLPENIKLARKLPERKIKSLESTDLQGFALVEVRRVELLYVCKVLYKNL